MKRRQTLDVSEAIGVIYDGVHDTGAWNKAVADLVYHVEGSSALLFTPYIGPADAGVWVQHSLDPSSLQSYSNYFVNRDVWLKGFAENGIAIGEVVRDSDLVAKDEFDRSEFYNDFLKLYDIERLLTVLIRPQAAAESQLHLSVYRPIGAEAFTDAHLGLAQILTSHLSRAWALKLALSGQDLRLHAVGSVLDRIEAGVILLDRRGSIAFANATVQKIFVERDGIADHGRRLSATSSKIDTQLQSLIAASISVNSAVCALDSGCLAVPRPSGRRPYLLMAGPVHRSSQLLGTFSAAALVVIRDPERRPRISTMALRKAMDLTEAEAQIVRHLAEGLSLAGHIARSGVSANTARWHLKNALHKAGCRNQVELATLALSIGSLVSN